MVKKIKKIDISKMFEDQQAEFLESLNSLIKEGYQASSMSVKKFEDITTQYGTSLRIEVVDTETKKEFSFLCSGKIFRNLFEANVEVGDIIKIYLTEKSHWRFEFSE